MMGRRIHYDIRPNKPKSMITEKNIREEGFYRAKSDTWAGYDDYYLNDINPHYPYYLKVTLHYPAKGWREDDNIEHRMTKIIVHRYYDNEDPEIERYLQDHESEVVFKGILADSQELNTLLIQLGIV